MKAIFSARIFFAAAFCIVYPHFVFSTGDDEYVTCGSAIKLSNKENGGGKIFLSSGQHQINTGSSQQLVTGSPKRSSSDLLWMISAGHDGPDCESGSKIPFGTKVRFTHINTGMNLHSHHFKSPLTRNQEVTAFGDGSGGGDNGDDWIIQSMKSGKYWMRGQTVLVTHSITGRNLGASTMYTFDRNNCGNRCPVMDHAEVFAWSGTPEQMQWSADLGLFLSA